MTSLVLKLIAVTTMLIDHTAVALQLCGKLPYGELYKALRAIGRIAFPLYGFMIGIGARYTANKLKYALRMLLTLLLSEIPFDMALFGSWQRGTLLEAVFAYFTNGHQNVYFTLFFGLITVFIMQWAFSQKGWKRALGVAFWAASVLAAALLCERFLDTDYGAAGILMIAVFGILALPLRTFRVTMASEHLVNLLISAAAILVLVFMTNELEWYAMFALLPIGFYNGKKGYSSRAVQYGFYLFYPAHLFILALLFIWPILKLKASIMMPW